MAHVMSPLLNYSFFGGPEMARVPSSDTQNQSPTKCPSNLQRADRMSRTEDVTQMLIKYGCAAGRVHTRGHTSTSKWSIGTFCCKGTIGNGCIVAQCIGVVHGFLKGIACVCACTLQLCVIAWDTRETTQNCFMSISLGISLANSLKTLDQRGSSLAAPEMLTLVTTMTKGFRAPAKFLCTRWQ